MRIVCNMPEGLLLLRHELRHGDNTISRGVWDEIKSKLDARYLAYLTTRVGCRPAQIEIYDDEPAAVDPKKAITTTATAAAGSEQYSAREKIAMIEAATSYETLGQLEIGETRKTVLAAIYKRAEEIDQAEGEL